MSSRFWTRVLLAVTAAGLALPLTACAGGENVGRVNVVDSSDGACKVKLYQNGKLAERWYTLDGGKDTCRQITKGDTYELVETTLTVTKAGGESAQYLVSSGTGLTDPQEPPAKPHRTGE